MAMMAKQEHLPGWLERLADPKHPYLYLAFVLLTNLLNGNVQDMATGDWRLTAPRLISIAGLVVLAVIGMLIGRRDERRLRAQARAEIEQAQKDLAQLEDLVTTPGQSRPSPPRRGLIASVSVQAYEELGARKAALHHCQPDEAGRCQMLRYLWLLHTPKPEKEPAPWPDRPKADHCTGTTPKPRPAPQSSYKNAEQLGDEFRQRGVVVIPVPILSEHDAREIFLQVMNAYQVAQDAYGLGDKDIVADITGGTKPTTVGVALAGIPTARDLQYLQQRGGFVPGGPPGESDAMLIDVNFAHFSDLWDPEIAELMRRQRRSARSRPGT